jgi:hypothetical protein
MTDLPYIVVNVINCANFEIDWFIDSNYSSFQVSPF